MNSPIINTIEDHFTNCITTTRKTNITPSECLFASEILYEQCKTCPNLTSSFSSYTELYEKYEGYSTELTRQSIDLDIKNKKTLYAAHLKAINKIERNEILQYDNYMKELLVAHHKLNNISMPNFFKW